MSFSPPEWVLQWNEIVTGLGTVVLTIFLVILYKRQQEQMAANHKAVLEVTDFEWDGDEATVYVSNFGNGVAKDLALATLVYVDTGEHRKYTLRLNHMKRQDKQGEWTNVITPGEEEIPLKGKSIVGKLAPISWSNNWIDTNFGDFIIDMSEKGANEVKYLHLVRGVELSNKRCIAMLQATTSGLNPQKFDHHHSLQDMPHIIRYGHDNTFLPYLHKSTTDRIMNWIYINKIQFLNWILPKVTIRSRPLDTSGTRRVKRVILRRNIRNIVKNIKRFILRLPNRIRN